jgi:hypothetical protein
VITSIIECFFAFISQTPRGIASSPHLLIAGTRHISRIQGEIDVNALINRNLS